MNGPLDLHPKVAAGLITGQLTAVILYVLHRWVDADLPVEVGAALASLLVFVASWLAPLSRADQAE